MVVDLPELARRMLADYDARTPGQCIGEPFDLTTAQAYALQAEIAGLREHILTRRVLIRSAAPFKVVQTEGSVKVKLGEPTLPIRLQRVTVQIVTPTQPGPFHGQFTIEPDQQDAPVLVEIEGVVLKK